MFYDNLKQVCDSQNISISAIVKECGGAIGSINGWKKGSMPNSEIVLRLSLRLNVSADYLLTGKEKSSSIELTSDEQKLLNHYNKLPYEEKIRLICRAETLAEIHNEITKEKIKPNTITMHCSKNLVSAGIGDELYDYEEWNTVEVIETNVSRKADFILVIDGDSMEPKFHDGDYILIRQQPAVDIGQIGIFNAGGKGVVKKYDGDKLISLNTKYKPINISDEDRCFGLVLGVAELA